MTDRHQSIRTEIDRQSWLDADDAFHLLEAISRGLKRNPATHRYEWLVRELEILTASMMDEYEELA